MSEENQNISAKQNPWTPLVQALEAAGAKVDGGGVGFGYTETSFTFQGESYSLRHHRKVEVPQTSEAA